MKTLIIFLMIITIVGCDMYSGPVIINARQDSIILEIDTNDGLKTFTLKDNASAALGGVGKTMSFWGNIKSIRVLDTKGNVLKQINLHALEQEGSVIIDEPRPQR